MSVGAISSASQTLAISQSSSIASEAASAPKAQEEAAESAAEQSREAETVSAPTATRGNNLNISA